VVTWNELNATLGASVPLNTVHGTFYQNIEPSASFNTKQVYYTGLSRRALSDRQFNYGEYSINLTNQQLKAKQHIYPHFAQTLSVRYRSALNKITASQLLVNGALYFPGLSANHSFVVQAAYQERDTLQQYNFSNAFPFSRGYQLVDFPRMWKVGVNYHFPIAYPDAGFGNIVYLLRVRGNAFYDFTETRSLRTGIRTNYRTAGAEVYFDSKWWNQLPLSVGIRFSRLLDNDLTVRSVNQWELVLPVNLLSR
jgi:hypothetical protein